MNPLSRVRSLKTKLSIIIALAVIVSATMTTLTNQFGWPLWLSPTAAIAVALVMVQALARGTTSPLREMVRATRDMSRGDYSRRVHTNSMDEVGQLARSFNAMAAELAETDRLRRDLVANVSHELRTPISALQALLENIIDGVVKPTPEILRAMHRQTERLGRLVADLLDLSRLESGNLSIEHTRVALASALNRATDECRLHYPALDVHIDVPSDLVVEGDAARLHQVFANLLDNAARHVGDDLLVDVVAEANGNGMARIAVTDHGPGVPPADRTRIFERFYRADHARSDDVGGSGLGLAIVRWIVDLHGGEIHVEDAEPHGCRMILELPLRR